MAFYCANCGTNTIEAGVCRNCSMSMSNNSSDHESPIIRETKTSTENSTDKINHMNVIAFICFVTCAYAPYYFEYFKWSENYFPGLIGALLGYKLADLLI